MMPSMSGCPIQGFPEQVGVAVVPGVFLDDVHVDPAQRIRAVAV